MLQTLISIRFVSPNTATQIFGPRGTVVLKISDTCGDCADYDVDVADTIFTKLDDPNKGRVKMSWQFVNCNINLTLIRRVFNHTELSSCHGFWSLRKPNFSIPLKDYQVQRNLIRRWRNLYQVDWNFLRNLLWCKRFLRYLQSWFKKIFFSVIEN